MIGRDAEIGVLLTDLGGALRDRRPHSVLLLGLPGIGKSRLRRELVDVFVNQGGSNLVTTSAKPSDSFASHVVIRGLLREILGAQGSATGELAHSLARRALDTLPQEDSSEVMVAALAALLDDRPGDLGALALPAAKRALIAAARRRPLLLIIDDAHWADDATLELVQALARGELEAPITLVVLARPELLERRPQLGRAFRRVMELGPLPADASLELARQLGLPAGSTEAQAIAGAAEGNPFFIEELVNELQERGAAGRPGLPSTVEEAIQARLDRLGPEEHEALRAAAVLGRTFRRRDLLAILDPAPARSLDAVLVELEDRRLVFALPPDAGADDRYAIKHALVRDVVYGELPAAARRGLHEAAARVLEARQEGAEPGVDQLVELARHLEGAEQRAKACGVYQQAGDLSRARAAFGEAHRCYVRARELAGDGATPGLLVALAEAATQVGLLDAAQEVLAQALTLTKDQPALATDAARACHALAAIAKLRNQWQDAIGLARRGLALIDERAEPVLAARLRCTAGWVLGYILGDNERGLPEVLGAVALLEGTPHLAELANAFGALGGNYMRAGRFRDQLDCNRRNLEIGEQLGAIDLQARAHLNLGVNFQGLGRIEESLAHTRSALAIYERMCATASIALARNNLAYSILDAEPADLDQAEPELREAIRLSDLCGGLYFRVEADLTAARICARRGDLHGALENARAGVARAGQSGGTIDQGIARKVLGAMLSLAGAHDEALGELDAALTLLAATDVGEHARVRAEKARALDRRGDAAGASAERAEARRVLEQLGAAGDLRHLESPGWI